ncbi:conserved hypothetical protein [Neospora caninum Liverpool]|nr:conserved hypothetical protein [Neospora caninum Liverpool]CBZ53109.1 conserved hypothetical protein [Neospora caninum Liverpool]|eukprot:XP_003883141.1 conserved hypothetical protein [Neospora caninum Liverpool]
MQPSGRGDASFLAGSGGDASGSGAVGTSTHRGRSRGPAYHIHHYGGAVSSSSQFPSRGGFAPLRRREREDNGFDLETVDDRVVGPKDRDAGTRPEKTGVSRSGRSTDAGRFAAGRGSGENPLFASGAPAFGDSLPAATPREGVQERGRGAERCVVGEGEAVSVASFASSYFVSVSGSRSAADQSQYTRMSTCTSTAVHVFSSCLASHAGSHPHRGPKDAGRGADDAGAAWLGAGVEAQTAAGSAREALGASLGAQPEQLGGATAVGEGGQTGGRGHRRQKSASRSHHSSAAKRKGEHSSRGGRQVSGTRRGHQRSKGREGNVPGGPVKLTAEVLLQLEEMSAASVGSPSTAFPCLSLGSATSAASLAPRDSDRSSLHFYNASSSRCGPSAGVSNSASRNEDDFFWMVKRRAEELRDKSGEIGRRCAAFQRAEGLVSSSRGSGPHQEEAKLDMQRENPRGADPTVSPGPDDAGQRDGEGLAAGPNGRVREAGDRRQPVGTEAPLSLLSSLFPSLAGDSRGDRRTQKGPRDDGASSGSQASSEESTKGTVNHKCRDDSKLINLCANPSDMWYGLTMSDGKPVCVRPRPNKWHANNTRRQRKQHKDLQKRLAQAQTKATVSQAAPSRSASGHFPSKKAAGASAHRASGGAAPNSHTVRYPHHAGNEASVSAGLGAASSVPSVSLGGPVTPVVGSSGFVHPTRMSLVAGVGASAGATRSPRVGPASLGKGEEGRRDAFSLPVAFPVSGESQRGQAPGTLQTATAQGGQPARERTSTIHRRHREHKKRGRSSSSTAATGVASPFFPPVPAVGAAGGPQFGGSPGTPGVAGGSAAHAAPLPQHGSTRGRRRHHRHHSKKSAGHGPGTAASSLPAGPGLGAAGVQEPSLGYAFSPPPPSFGPGDREREREHPGGGASDDVARVNHAGGDRENGGRGAEANRVVFVALPGLGATGPSGTARPARTSPAPLMKSFAFQAGSGFPQSTGGPPGGAGEGRGGAQRPLRRARLDEAGSFVPICPPGKGAAGRSPQLGPVAFPGEFKMPRPVVFPPGDRRHRLPKKLRAGGSGPVSAGVASGGAGAQLGAGGGAGWVPSGGGRPDTDKGLGSVGRAEDVSATAAAAASGDTDAAGALGSDTAKDEVRESEQTAFALSSSSRRPGVPSSPEVCICRPLPSYGDLEGYEEGRNGAKQRAARGSQVPSTTAEERCASSRDQPAALASGSASAAPAPRPASTSGYGVVVETGTVGVPSSACLFPYQRKSAPPHTPVSSERRSGSGGAPRSRRREDRSGAGKKRTGKKPKKSRAGEPQRWTSARERVQWHLAKSRGMI